MGTGLLSSAEPVAWSDIGAGCTDALAQAAGSRSFGLLANSRLIAAAMLRDGRILFANHAFETLFGAAGTLSGAMLHDLTEDSLGDSLSASIAAAEREPVSYLGSGKRADGQSFSLELALEYLDIEGASTLVVFAWDITKRVRSTRQLSHLAYTDSLTGLANRVRFTDTLRTMLRPSFCGGRVALLMLDLDGFKAVNDDYGHDAGDAVLEVAARRIAGCLREEDTAARLGGDEFGIIIPRLEADESAALVALRVLGAFAAPISLGMREVTVGASIGIAVIPTHADTAEGLLVAADTALYTAKRAGKGRYAWATKRSSPEARKVEPLQWISAHALGVPLIDEQHAHLIALVNDLLRTLCSGETQGQIRARLEVIIRYAKLHFATEEQIMRDEQIEDYAQHREEHQRLLEEIESLDLPGDNDNVRQIVRYLREWVLRHMHGYDQRLATALLAKAGQGRDPLIRPAPPSSPPGSQFPGAAPADARRQG